jgi:hypothetical protein
LTVTVPASGAPTAAEPLKTMDAWVTGGVVDVLEPPPPQAAKAMLTALAKINLFSFIPAPLLLKLLILLDINNIHFHAAMLTQLPRGK